MIDKKQVQDQIEEAVKAHNHTFIVKEGMDESSANVDDFYIYILTSKNVLMYAIEAYEDTEFGNENFFLHYNSFLSGDRETPDSSELVEIFNSESLDEVIGQMFEDMFI